MKQPYTISLNNIIKKIILLKTKPANIVLASGNKKKVVELQLLLQSLSIPIIPQSTFSIPDPVENGLTFVENAIIKARHASKLSGLPAIADDSGLEVDALNGMPGIYSARFAGHFGPGKQSTGSNDADNNLLLLEKMQDIRDEQRSARFQCVLVFLRHAEDPVPIICQGTWEGRILMAAQGTNGFGYDPVFYVPGHNCSAAELSMEEKTRISHRGHAMQKLLMALNDLYG